MPQSDDEDVRKLNPYLIDPSSKALHVVVDA
jgi:hypothetical protein